MMRTKISQIKFNESLQYQSSNWNHEIQVFKNNKPPSVTALEEEVEELKAALAKERNKEFKFRDMDKLETKLREEAVVII